ncbi:hypothetical protein BaRGS_00038278 [Batillaria attramentaria]|uniref:C2H2-type domain-containing protein n=1 Tax=Batillaria attramentaria TaxID=370345 RepID=A0ABD0J6L8_9CAEN
MELELSVEDGDYSSFEEAQGDNQEHSSSSLHSTSRDAGSKKRRMFTPSQGSAGSSAAAQANAASNRKRPTSGISRKRRAVFQVELDRDLLGYRNKQGGVQLTARCQLCVAPLAQYCTQCTDQLLQGRQQPPGGAVPQDSQLTAQRRSQSLHTVSVSSVRADTIKSVHSITQQNMSRIDSANHTLKQGGETQQLKQQTHAGTNRDSQRDTSSSCGTLEVDSEETNSLTSCVKAGGVKREDYDNTDTSVYSSGDGRERSHASALNARRNGIKLEPLDSGVTDDSLMADVAGSGSDSCETSAPLTKSARRENSGQASRSSANDNSRTAASGCNTLPASHESISVGSANQRSEEEALTLGDSSVSENSSVLSSVSAIALAQAHSDSAEPGRFACELCPRTFDTIPQLRLHSKLHRDEHDADEAEWQEQQTEQVETPTMKRRSAYAIPMDEWRLSHADNPHQLVSNPPTKKQPRPSRDCECCTIRAGMRNGYIRRSQTKFMCKACQVPLCVEPCFHVYHAFHHYKQEMRRRYNIDGGGQ